MRQKTPITKRNSNDDTLRRLEYLAEALTRTMEKTRIASYVHLIIS